MCFCVSVFFVFSFDGFIVGDNGDLLWLELFLLDLLDDIGYMVFMNDIDVIVMGCNMYDMVINFDLWLYVGKWMVVMMCCELVLCYGEELFDGMFVVLFEQLVK